MPARCLAACVVAILSLLAQGCEPSAGSGVTAPPSKRTASTQSANVPGKKNGAAQKGPKPKTAVETQNGDDDADDEVDSFDADDAERGEGKPAIRDSYRAVDAVAAEIVEGLRLRGVLVVWLVDATSSAATLRKEVVERLATTCPKLEASAKRLAKPHPLRWAAVSFGKEARFLLSEPTADGKQLVGALDSLEQDESGVENTFAAVEAAADRFLGGGQAKGAAQKAGKTFVIFVVVTDEVGDDANLVDALAQRLEQAVVPVYTIGPAAPFGNELSLAPVIEVENLQQIRQGPESRYPEFVPPPAGDPSRHAARLDSGCGPFALTYLARRTAGNSFIVRSDAGWEYRGLRVGPESDVVRFDPRVVATHLPDYVSEAEYQQLMAENKARMAVHRAATLPKVTIPPELKREFGAGDAAVLKRQLDDAQRGVAKLQPQLRKVYDVIAAGESDRARLKSPRWQAEFDLAMGCVLAARAHWEGYNSMLAVLKNKGTFTRPESTRWVLVEAEGFTDDSSLNRLAGQSRKYLERVVSEHAGTPWAWLAERELAIPMAWKWEER
ncbi:MAG TPA: vWA domain-containing protein [Pirellulales bacterium]|nr:vWA domain-containing protein [Pirellulales bacterium]